MITGQRGRAKKDAVKHTMKIAKLADERLREIADYNGSNMTETFERAIHREYRKMRKEIAMMNARQAKMLLELNRFGKEDLFDNSSNR